MLLIVCNTIQYNGMQCNTIQCNAMQCNAMQYNTIQLNAMQYNAMQCNDIQCNAMQCNTMQCNAIQCNAMQYNILQCLRMGVIWPNFLNLFTIRAVKFWIACNLLILVTEVFDHRLNNRTILLKTKPLIMATSKSLSDACLAWFIINRPWIGL